MGKSIVDHAISSTLLGTLMENVPWGIVFLDPAGRIRLVNRNAKEFLQIPEPIEALPGKSFPGTIKHLPMLAGEIATFLRQPIDDYRAEPVLIGDQYLELSFIVNQGGSMFLITDITREKEMEADAVQSIITSQENERRRVARDIHDGIAPLLSYAKLELEMFMEDLKTIENQIPEEKLENIRQTIDAISNDLRGLSHRLIPRLLEEFGLLSAFNNLIVKTNESTRSRVELFCNLNTKERIDQDVELNLFRCGQELLNNAVRHAGATKIMMQVIRHDDSIVLMVEDDGVGFNPGRPASENDGIGLKNVETRVRTLNGQFIVETKPGHGTLVSIEIPL